MNRMTMLRSGRRFVAAPFVYNPTLAHVGPAILPTWESDYVSSNATTGYVHYPMTPAELNTLLTGGSLSGHVLAAGDTIILQDGTLYNSLSYNTQTFHPVAGAVDNPIRVMSSRLLTDDGPAPGTRILESDLLATPHFQVTFNSLPPIVIPDGSHGWQFIGIEADCGSAGLFTYWLFSLGTEKAAQSWAVGTTYALGAKVEYLSGDAAQLGVNGVTLNYPKCAWISLSAGNVGNTPVDGSAYWRKLVVDDLPRKLVFDRVSARAMSYGASAKCRLLFRADVGETVWTGCHFWSEGGYSDETKAIGGMTMSGKVLVDNCKLVVPAIPIMFAGAEPLIVGLQIEDTIVRRCYFYRPNYWNRDHGDYDNNWRMIKNFLEWKRFVRALAEDCVFENGWDASQSQVWEVVAKNTSNGAGALAQARDLTLRSLKFINAKGPFGLGGNDIAQNNNYARAEWPMRMSVYQSYSTTTINPGPGYKLNDCMALSHNVDGAHLEHLTFLADYGSCRATLTADGYDDYTEPKNWVWRNCILPTGAYGLNSSGGVVNGNDNFTRGVGSSAAKLLMYCAGHPTWLGGPYAKYPNPPFTFTATAGDLVRNYAGGDMRPAVSLTGTGYNSETPGCDTDMVDYRTRGCISGVWT